jgi:hypothetical protein
MFIIMIGSRIYSQGLGPRRTSSGCHALSPRVAVLVITNSPFSRKSLEPPLD